MQSVRQRISSVHWRQQAQWMLQCASWGLFAGGVLALAASVLTAFGVIEQHGWWYVAGILAAGPVFGLLISLLLPRSVRQAAVSIDRKYGLKDRISTALAFLSTTEPTALQSLQLADAESHVSAVDPSQVAPYRWPKSLTPGALAAIAAIVLLVVTQSPEPAAASLATDDVVAAQADRVAGELDELEEFNSEQPDPEVEELLKQLSQKIEELKQPGVDPKEALAKLSEMQAALEQKQAELADPQLEAQLQSVGEALSLEKSLEAAGQALSAGEYEKAAAEMEKLEMPELDRQTERAMTEKLDKISDGSGKGSQRRLKEAIASVSQSLGNRNRGQFSEGMNRLAGECRKQGRRKKLADLLRKQCRSLSECKGQCESACKSEGQSNKKGGKKWGLASSGNEPGDKTPLLKSAQEMKLKGQESGQGDVDVETIETQEGQQSDAVRQYRENSEKYEQLSESVLDSEPIPLGHRQTIRRYFELIRPQAEEVDAVFEETADPAK